MRDGWLEAALDYLPQWLEFQMRAFARPGVAMAVVHKGDVVLETAFGTADGAAGEALTPRHRFRVASHSKSFTAAAIMKLREAGRLGLDDPAGRFVAGLHPQVAAATVQQLLSHGAGLVRDGADAGQWQLRRPFLSRDELLAELAAPPVIPGTTRLKYSNHGYALLGLIVEAASGLPFADYLRQEILAPAGLAETQPDGPPAPGVPFAKGHSRPELLDRRVVVPAEVSCGTMAAAGGFVSTAADLARFFAQLDPAVPHGVLSAASRREMVRPLWSDPHSSIRRSYGLGIISGAVADWDWLGHSGSFPGTLSCTYALQGRDLSVSILTNSLDGLANAWIEGAVKILRTFATEGPASEATRPWRGRFWSMWGPMDLVALNGCVKVAQPSLIDPFLDATEIAVSSEDPERGSIALAGGFGSHGEPVRLLRDGEGAIREVRLGGMHLRRPQEMAEELVARFVPVAP